MKNIIFTLTLFVIGLLALTPESPAQVLIQNLAVSYEKPLDSALIQITKLQPQQFILKDKGTVKKNSFGFQVNEFEKVFPFMVSTKTQIIKADNFPKSNFTKTSEIKSIDYVSLVPILVAAMQEQQAMILRQQQQIDALYKMLYTK